MIATDELRVLEREPQRLAPQTMAEKLEAARRWLAERAWRHPEWAVRRLWP